MPQKELHLDLGARRPPSWQRSWQARRPQPHEREKGVTLNLVAYSTPKPVLTKLISEFQKTPTGRRHQHQERPWPVLGARVRPWRTGSLPTE